MRAIRYFVTEAAASLWRGRSAAGLAVLTIAVGLFVLGLFLALNANLQRIVGRWTESAELSVYLKDEATREELRVVDDLVARSGLAAEREYVSKQQAADCDQHYNVCKHMRDHRRLKSFLPVKIAGNQTENRIR